MIECVKRWKQLSDEQKNPYVDMAKKDKQRHDAQWKELREKNYFTLESGQRSTEVELKAKKEEMAKKALEERAEFAIYYEEKETKSKFK